MYEHSLTVATLDGVTCITQTEQITINPKCSLASERDLGFPEVESENWLFSSTSCWAGWACKDWDGGGGEHACIWFWSAPPNPSLHTGQPKSAAWHCEGGEMGWKRNFIRWTPVIVCMSRGCEVMGSRCTGASCWLKTMEWYSSADTLEHLFSFLEHMNIDYIWIQHLLCMCAYLSAWSLVTCRWSHANLYILGRS